MSYFLYIFIQSCVFQYEQALVHVYLHILGICVHFWVILFYVFADLSDGRLFGVTHVGESHGEDILYAGRIPMFFRL